MQATTPFKLASFESAGANRAGLLVRDKLVDIESAVRDLPGVAETPHAFDMLSLITHYDTVAPLLYRVADRFAAAGADADYCCRPEDVHLAAPVKYPWNLIAIAANYRRHAQEMGHREQVDPDRDAPYMFAKSPRSCIVDPGTPFIIPAGRERVDWEGELAVVMGSVTRNVDLSNALDHVFGFTILFDVSDRAPLYRAQPSFGVDWFAMKSRDGAAPMGPYLVPKEFLPGYDDLPISTRVNDEYVQQSSTSYMIYDVAHLVSFTSSIMTLYPGDVIATGTPEGVGVSRDPPVFLKRGDVVSITVEGIGTLETPIA